MARDCSVCGEPVHARTTGPVIVVKSMKYYQDWRADAGVPNIRRTIVLCPKHVHYLIEPLKEMTDESERMAEDEGD